LQGIKHRRDCSRHAKYCRHCAVEWQAIFYTAIYRFCPRRHYTFIRRKAVLRGTTMWPSSFTHTHTHTYTHTHTKKEKRTDQRCGRRPEFLRYDHSFVGRIKRLCGPGSIPRRQSGIRAHFIRVGQFRLSSHHFSNASHILSPNANNSLLRCSTWISVWPQYDHSSVQCGADPIVTHLAGVKQLFWPVAIVLWQCFDGTGRPFCVAACLKTRQTYNCGFRM
jgi:hypothetical protein